MHTLCPATRHNCVCVLNVNFELKGHGDLYVLHILPVPVRAFSGLVSLHGPIPVRLMEDSTSQVACECAREWTVAHV